jgi:hypothetical protein
LGIARKKALPEGTNNPFVDKSKAEKYFRMAYEYGHPRAGLLLADMLDKTNPKESAALYEEQAIKYNDPESMIIVGEMLLNDNELERDYNKGIYYLRKGLKAIESIPSFMYSSLSGLYLTGKTTASGDQDDMLELDYLTGMYYLENCAKESNESVFIEFLEHSKHQLELTRPNVFFKTEQDHLNHIETLEQEFKDIKKAFSGDFINKDEKLRNDPDLKAFAEASRAIRPEMLQDVSFKLEIARRHLEFRRRYMYMQNEQECLEYIQSLEDDIESISKIFRSEFGNKLKPLFPSILEVYNDMLQKTKKQLSTMRVGLS